MISQKIRMGILRVRPKVACPSLEGNALPSSKSESPYHNLSLNAIRGSQDSIEKGGKGAMGPENIAEQSKKKRPVRSQRIA